MHDVPTGYPPVPMIRAALQGLGGLGLFLLGMVVMTEGLALLASGAVRGVLARQTRSTARGALAGALTTALVQSSSVTTVATVGFVGAGLLTFPNALGIVFGANAGTTVTGWIVATLGFKLDLGTIVPPVILAGVLLRLFGRGTPRSVGLALAGFGLVFLGIEVLKSGMAGLEGELTPADLPGESLGGRIALVGIGFAVTAVTQSSSAGVATAIAALHARTISFEQAGALVVGMDIGTTLTALVATIGATTAARRTGAAHVIYNVITGIGAFLLLPVYATILREWARAEPELALVGFHTAFNVLGVLLVLPVAGRFAHFIERLVPERGPRWTEALEPVLLSQPPLALHAVERALRERAAAAFAFVTTEASGDVPDRERALDRLEEALSEVRAYLDRVPVADRDSTDTRRRESAMHVVDHLRRMLHRCRAQRLERARRDEELEAWTARFVDALAAGEGAAEERLAALHRELDDAEQTFRARLLRRAAAEDLTVDEALRKLDDFRALRRLCHHGWRIAHHLARPTDATSLAAAAATPSDEFGTA